MNYKEKRHFVGNLYIFPLISPRHIISINGLTMILKITSIGQFGVSFDSLDICDTVFQSLVSHLVLAGSLLYWL